MKAAQKTMNSIRILAVILTGFWAVALAQEAAHVPPPSVAEPKRQPPATPQCDVDLRDTDTMSSIISNVLIRAEHKPEREVSAFLNDAASRTATGDDLLKVAAAHYRMDQKKLATSVEHWRHINCEHAAIPGFAVPDSQAVDPDSQAVDEVRIPIRSHEIRIRGSLILCGAGEFPDHIFKTFAHLAQINDPASDKFAIVFCDNSKQRAFKTLKSLVGDKVELVDCSSDNLLRKIPDAVRDRVKKCSGVWLDLTSPPSAERYAALMVPEVFEQGKVVGAAGTWASQMLSISPTGGDSWTGLQLTPHCRMHLVKDYKHEPLEASLLEKGMVHWLVPDETALILHEGRTATSHGSFLAWMVTVPLQGEPVKKVLNLTSIDSDDSFEGSSLKTEIRKSRFRPELHPPFRTDFTSLEKGTLILNGGGGVSDETFNLFVEAAGGKEARFVCIPTAGDDDDDSYSARKLTTLGCKHVSILHTRDPAVADSDQQVLKMLDEANGIWIDGGRTYRVMEAYENTQVQKKIYAILQRGGVFGGSSAGCQLASEFLVRGNPETSDQLEFPLYNRGLGLLTGVILDAHFRQRHREYEFGYLVLLHPELLGIGVDEGTSIVVKGEIATVVGANGVTFFDATKPVSKGGNFSVPTQTFLKSGSRFNLRTRQPIP